MTYRLSFQPPPGVSIQQTREGTLLVHYAVDMIAPLRASLQKLSDDLLEQAVNEAKAKAKAEQDRQQLPKDRLSILNEEIQRLEAQRTSAPPAAMPPAAPLVTAPASVVSTPVELVRI